MTQSSRSDELNRKVLFITGAAKRLGAVTAKHFHQQGYNVILHYGRSKEAAEQLQHILNSQRKNSCELLQGDLTNPTLFRTAKDKIESSFGRLDVLINNASSFFPNSLEDSLSEHSENWDDLMGTNLKAPYFLSALLAEELKKTGGCILNMVDIHSERPLKNHPIYTTAKAGLNMLTRSLAKELAPEIRVNGVSPGAILWPDNGHELSISEQTEILKGIPLDKLGTPDDIARTLFFLAEGAPYITGQIIAVDGGRSI